VFYVPPVCCPFPDIANNVVKMKCIRREFCDRASAYVTIFCCVGIRKLPLPNICPEKVLKHSLLSNFFEQAYAWQSQKNTNCETTPSNYCKNLPVFHPC